MDEEYAEVLEGILGLAKAVEKNDELFEVGARIVRKAFDALLKVGFMPDQAIQILTSVGGSGRRGK